MLLCLLSVCLGQPQSYGQLGGGLDAKPSSGGDTVKQEVAGTVSEEDYGQIVLLLDSLRGRFASRGEQRLVAAMHLMKGEYAVVHGEFVTAGEELCLAERLAQSEGDSALLLSVYIAQGYLSGRSGDALASLRLYRRALQLVSDSTTYLERLNLLYSLASTYESQAYYTRAEEFYRAALQLAQDSATMRYVTRIYAGLAQVELHKGNKIRAFSNLYMALRQGDDMVGVRTLRRVHRLLAELYAESGCWELAEMQARYIMHKLGGRRKCRQQVKVYQFLANLREREGRAQESMPFLDSAMHYAEQGGDSALLYGVVLDRAELLAHFGAYGEGFSLLQQYYRWRARARRMQYHPEYQKERAALASGLQRVEENYEKVSNSRLFRMVRVCNIVSVFGVLVALSGGFFAFRWRQRRRERQQLLRRIAEGAREYAREEEVLAAKRREFKMQEGKLRQVLGLSEMLTNEQEQNKQRLVKSVNQMRNIQRSLLPSMSALSAGFEGTFLFYSPRNVVSGDFYWYEEVDGVKLISVIDCVGHGVPGAMMNLIGYVILGKIVRDRRIMDPAGIIEALHYDLLANLGGKSEGAYGHYTMDLTVVAVDSKRGELTFSSASSSLYLVREGKLERFRGSLMSAGSSLSGVPFTSTTLPLEGVDCLYLTTDGMVDQMNVDFRKLGWQRFGRKLEEVHTLPAEEQRAALVALFEAHKGAAEQTDDVCVLGIKFR